ncbi:two-component regulator propeller domain-containing protein [Bacteroides sp. AN502(2024)]|uniref:hybrid sensor histidine kinase/response regulator transcription factor n=1 Tax=Bacteroides sp. AN502(2024) TaxID=3160599 RepID=UPI003518764E
MKYLNLILFILIVSSCPINLVHAFFDKDIRLLTMQDGLADNTITSIHKDDDGFMWFGTNDGISRYDGRTVRNFKPQESYLPNAVIVRLSHDYLGVVSNGTFHAYNRKREAFIPVSFASGMEKFVFNHVLPVDESSFWGVIGNRLLLCRWEEQVEPERNTVTVRIGLQKEYDLLPEQNAFFSAICYDGEKKDRIWLTTNKGDLFLFCTDTSEIYKKVSLDNGKALQITSVLSRQGIVWVSTLARGIIRYHTYTGHIDRISYGGTGKENLLSHTDVYETIYIGNNRYLAATWSGYTLLMPDGEKKEELTSEIYNYAYTQIHRNLETRMISAFYDPNGVLWIGTNGGGVMYSDLRSQFYNRYYQDRHNEICSVIMDDERHIWLATFHKGIMRSDTPYIQNGKLRFSAVDVKKENSEETILCALKDSVGNLWFGNKNGMLTVYNTRLGKFINRSLVIDGTVNKSPVWALYMDQKGRLWIGTEHGLLLYEQQTGICVKLPVDRWLNEKGTIWVRALAQTEDGTMWLGTSEQGVCRVVESASGNMAARKGYEQSLKLDYHSVRSLLASSDGNLYVGYTDGFAILSPSQDAISEFYTTADGLCSNFIGCVVEDAKGHIWLGSNSGISRYSRHQHLFYNYYIAGSNRSALFSCGTLFFGNNQSLTYFEPDEIDAWPNNERVLITGLEVDNRSVEIGKEINNQIVLDKMISYTEQVILNHANRDIALIFNNLSYSNEQQKYNYRLLPYQESWLISDDGEKAVYTNLAAGDYVFEVRSIYPDGQAGPVTSLKIVILPHWSNTLIFRIFIFLLVSVGIMYCIRLIKMRQKRLEHEMQMKHELLTVRMEREKEHQIRLERENFFTGVAHELRTPLTLILAPLQELIKQGTVLEPFYKKLQIMYENATSLHTLVDHLLYVQKIEAGMVKLQLSESDLVQVIKSVSEPFRQMAEIRGLRFEVNLPERKLMYWIDRPKIASAIQNLLSNAFKYTSSGGSVSLSVSRMLKDGQGYCQIVVSDTGTGIPVDLQKHVFESFITGENVPEMSTKIGVGLHIVKNTIDLHHGLVTLESMPGEGSTFVLYIPDGKEHFAKDAYEIVDCQQEHTTQNNEQESSSLKPGIGMQETVAPKGLLIIEDNEDVREYIRSLFVSKYMVYEAGNGEEGVRMAKEKLPDLIISDVMMPVKDGFTCCEEIRSQQETAHIPILMLTAKAEDADILQGSRSGADDYMMKPFNPEVLKAKVDNLILQREQLKRIYTKALMLKQKSEEREPEDAFLLQLVHVIEANIPNENFNVKMLAEQLNMSQPTLYRKVKQRSDLSVIDMIRSIRISKAASLILENRYSIQEITEMVGYSDTRTLRKHFTEHFGVSPSKYMGEI